MLPGCPLKIKERKLDLVEKEIRKRTEWTLFTTKKQSFPSKEKSSSHQLLVPTRIAYTTSSLHRTKGELIKASTWTTAWTSMNTTSATSMSTLNWTSTWHLRLSSSTTSSRTTKWRVKRWSTTSRTPQLKCLADLWVTNLDRCHRSFSQLLMQA